MQLNTLYTPNIIADGDVTADAYNITSDVRYKIKINDLNDKSINVDWKEYELKSKPGDIRYGVVAQELEINHPEFVTTNVDGLKSVNYIDLLVAKINELENRIKELEKK